MRMLLLLRILRMRMLLLRMGMRIVLMVVMITLLLWRWRIAMNFWPSSVTFWWPSVMLLLLLMLLMLMLLLMMMLSVLILLLLLLMILMILLLLLRRIGRHWKSHTVIASVRRIGTVTLLALLLVLFAVPVRATTISGISSASVAIERRHMPWHRRWRRRLLALLRPRTRLGGIG